MSKTAEWLRNFLDTLFPSSRRMENRLIAHLEAEIIRLRHERDVIEADCQRMRLAIMPLTSLAGVAVAGAVQKKELPVSSIEAPALSFPRELSWSEIVAENDRANEEADAADLAAKEN